MASNVRLGVATLNVMTGVGESVSDVNEDIVIARAAPSWIAVHTTTDCESSRITVRSCSGGGFGVLRSVVGGNGRETCHGAAFGDDVRNPCEGVSASPKISYCSTTWFKSRTNMLDLLG